MSPHVAFDAALKRQGAGRTSDAGAVQTDADDALFGYIEQFHVPAVGLDGRSHPLDDPGDALVYVAPVRLG